MDFPIYYNKKDPLNLQSLINEGTKQNDLKSKAESIMIQIALSPEKQKSKEIAQTKRAEKAKSLSPKNGTEAHSNLIELINESMNKGIFPIPFENESKIESEISAILDDIHKKLQISNLSIFVMTKIVCYKFYLLFPYGKLEPKLAVSAAFLYSAEFFGKFCKNSII